MRTDGNLNKIPFFHHDSAGYWLAVIGEDNKFIPESEWKNLDEDADIKEWHISHMGGGIYEIEYCPANNFGQELFRGRLDSGEDVMEMLYRFQEFDKTARAEDLGENL